MVSICKMVVFFFFLHIFYCIKELYAKMYAKRLIACEDYFFQSRCDFSIPLFELDRYFVKMEKLVLVVGN